MTKIKKKAHVLMVLVDVQDLDRKKKEYILNMLICKPIIIQHK